ncbi:hypothetical protein [Tautonia sociabilis]|uniref:Uncharacterized protein n=1 Tax=Tautonia sociabilis TaxID=2080755 RepID=A0A432MCU3_9BACT|nr:hypothetical protein [Tautonia sociabilis]RUL82320.1 hypothetical protein TsocGM_23680 [Tautonia sociabilis]
MSSSSSCPDSIMDRTIGFITWVRSRPRIIAGRAPWRMSSAKTPPGDPGSRRNCAGPVTSRAKSLPMAALSIGWPALSAREAATTCLVESEASGVVPSGAGKTILMKSRIASGSSAAAPSLKKGSRSKKPMPSK